MAGRRDLARDLAQQAGALILAALRGRHEVRFKSPVDLVTEVDLRAQQVILEGIARAFPDDAVVAEEDQRPRPPAGPCWYVDPLDGTTNFVHGLPHFAVSIAYVGTDGPEEAAVFDPVRGELFHASRGRGAFLGSTAIEASPCRRLSQALLVTGFPYDRRQHLDAYLAYFRAFLATARDVRRFGSASLDLCYVASGRFDGFWEWKLSPWDTAAGWLIAQEAGATVTDFRGNPFDPWGTQILATSPEIHGEIVEVLRACAASSPSPPPAS